MVTLLMSVLDRIAGRYEQSQAFEQREFGVVAIFRYGHSVRDQLHDEVRKVAILARFEDFGDIGMIQFRQRLPFGLEAGDNLSGVVAGLDKFQSDLTMDRFHLLSLIDDTHPAFAQNFLQDVWADASADVLLIKFSANGLQQRP